MIIPEVGHVYTIRRFGRYLPAEGVSERVTCVAVFRAGQEIPFNDGLRFFGGGAQLRDLLPCAVDRYVLEGNFYPHRYVVMRADQLKDGYQQLEAEPV